MTKPQRWGLIAAGVSLALATLVPWAFLPRVRYDPMVALTLISVWAILATVAYAADNLKEFRKATEAEYIPLLDVTINTTYVRGDTHLEIVILNMGRGIAGGLEVALWWTDADLTTWIPHRLEKVARVVRPAEETSDTVEEPMLHFTIHKHFDPSTPQLVLQLRYRDSFGRLNERFLPYEIGQDDRGYAILVPSAQKVPADLTSVDGKKALLDGLIRSVLQDYDLATHGIQVESYVDRQVMQIAVRKGNVELWRAQTGVSQAAYNMGEWLDSALPDIIRKVENAHVEAFVRDETE